MCSCYLWLHNIASPNLVASAVKAVSFLCEICNLGRAQWRQLISAPHSTNWGSFSRSGRTHPQSQLTHMAGKLLLGAQWELLANILISFPYGPPERAPWASSHHGSWIGRVSGRGKRGRCCKSHYSSSVCHTVSFSWHSTN